MRKLFLTLFISIFSLYSYAQYGDEEYDVPEGDDYSTPATESEIRYSKLFETSRIYGEYEWFYKKSDNSYDKTRGVLKNGKVILPMLFKKEGYNYTKSLILKLGDYYGIYNLETQNWDVPLSYTYIKQISDNIFGAKKDGKYGVIDGSNNIVSKFQWDYLKKISDFENYVEVKVKKGGNSYYGIYNILTSKMVVDAKYKDIDKIYGSSLFKVENEIGLYNVIDIRGNELFKEDYISLKYRERNGQVFIAKNNSGKMGILALDGSVKVAFKYKYISRYPFKDGSFLAQNEAGKFGCIDVQGNTTLPFTYDNFEAQEYKGIAFTNINGKCGLIRVNNGVPYELATCDYDNLETGNKAFIVQKNGKYGLLDEDGKPKTDLKYDKIETLTDDLLHAKVGKNSIILSNTGLPLSKDKFLDIDKVPDYDKSSSYYSYSSSSSKPSFLKVKFASGKWALYDLYGVEVTKDIFEEIVAETNNIIISKSNGKLGMYSIITKKNVVPYEYDQIIKSKRGYYGIKGKDFYLINTSGVVKITKL